MSDKPQLRRCPICGDFAVSGYAIDECTDCLRAVCELRERVQMDGGRVTIYRRGIAVHLGHQLRKMPLLEVAHNAMAREVIGGGA